MEQNIFLQDLVNVGLRMLGYMVRLIFFFYGGLWSLDIHKITICTHDRTANTHK